MRHLVWDWNGTLFDDLHVVVDSVNASLARLGEGPIDAAVYRAHYRRPVPRFYESLLGRAVDPETWRMIDEVFHITYRESLARAALAPDALRAVAGVAGSGGTQSILSMWWHEDLVPTVKRFGLEEAMLLVDGNRGEAGEAKGAHLDRHLERLRGLEPGVERARTVVVGDITDDAEAAAAAGVSCVLYDSGSQPREVLGSCGVPVAETLMEAVSLAGFGG